MSVPIGRVKSVTVTTALYRRYRPDSFADVIGQEHVTVPLQQALRRVRELFGQRARTHARPRFGRQERHAQHGVLPMDLVILKRPVLMFPRDPIEDA